MTSRAKNKKTLIKVETDIAVLRTLAKEGAKCVKAVKKHIVLVQNQCQEIRDSKSYSGNQLLIVDKSIFNAFSSFIYFRLPSLNTWDSKHSPIVTHHIKVGDRFTLKDLFQDLQKAANIFEACKFHINLYVSAQRSLFSARELTYRQVLDRLEEVLSASRSFLHSVRRKVATCHSLIDALKQKRIELKGTLGIGTRLQAQMLSIAVEQESPKKQLC